MNSVRPTLHDIASPSYWGFASLILGLLLGGLLYVCLAQTDAKPLPEPPLAKDDRLQCVSYAPFRKPGQSPFVEGLTIPAEQIESDLRALSRIARCVRTYSVDQGLDKVPELARKVGMNVLLGAWVGRETAKNGIELARAIALANAHPDVVRALIVGNEVLLRRDQPVGALRELIQSAQRQARVPVTYADVWEFWLRHADLATDVDWVTVHILPFWEDEPVAIDEAATHVAEVVRKVKGNFQQPILIGETGWPSAGRQREHSVPSRVNQAHYVREFIRIAEQEGWQYNLIEAIDQPWKRRLEGTVGGHWGMLSPELAPKFALTGPMAERDSLQPVGWASLGGLCLTLLASLRPAGRPAAQWLALALAGALGGLLGLLHFEHALAAYRNGLEWAVLGSLGLLAALLPLWLARWSGRRLPALTDCWPPLRAQPAPLADRALSLNLALFQFALTSAAILLAVDPRYRDFPSLLYALPATLALLLAPWRAHAGLAERRLALLGLLAVVARWSSEPTNLQAVGWLACGGLLCLAPWLSDFCNRTSKATNPAGTA